MATKLPQAQKRLFTGVFICKNCSHKQRTQSTRILTGKVRCRKCGSHSFRPIKRK